MFDITDEPVENITLIRLKELVSFSTRDNEILMTVEQDKAYRELLHDDDKDNEIVFL